MKISATLKSVVYPKVGGTSGHSIIAAGTEATQVVHIEYGTLGFVVQLKVSELDNKSICPRLLKAAAKHISKDFAITPAELANLVAAARA